MEVTAAQHRLHQLASVSLVALIVLCVLWELVLAHCVRVAHGWC